MWIAIQVYFKPVYTSKSKEKAFKNHDNSFWYIDIAKFVHQKNLT